MSEHTCGGRGPVPCPACVALAAQERYARQWREQHPGAVYTMLWTCGLCGMVVQTAPNLRHAVYGPSMITVHKQGHGDSWIEYERLQAPGGADGEMGE